MLGLSRKKGPVPPGMPPGAGGMGVPTQKVMSLSSQGMSEAEIIKTLREQGHTPLEVDRAMKGALRNTAGGAMRGPPQAQRAPPRPPGPSPPASSPGVRPGPQAGVQPGPPVPPSAQPPGPAPMEEPRLEPTMEPPMPRHKYAPTDWDEEDEDMADDDFDEMEAEMERVPKEKKIGPGAFMEGIDERTPEPMPLDKEPLPFAEAPLPKGRDERSRAIKERRRREIEELTEEITQEKWQDIMNKVRELDEKTEKLSMEIKNSATQGSGPSPEELGAIKNDITTVRQSLEETNARIDSLEEVVKGSITPMLNSVRKLKSMTGGAETPAQGPPRQSQSQAPPPEQASAAPHEEPTEPPSYASKHETESEE